MQQHNNMLRFCKAITFPVRDSAELSKKLPMRLQKVDKQPTRFDLIRHELLDKEIRRGQRYVANHCLQHCARTRSCRPDPCASPLRLCPVRNSAVHSQVQPPTAYPQALNHTSKVATLIPRPSRHVFTAADTNSNGQRCLEFSEGEERYQGLLLMFRG